MIKWLATFLLIWFIYHVRSVFPPFILGAIVAYLLLPVVKQCSISLKVPRTVAVAAIYLTTAIVLATLSSLFVPVLLDQTQALIAQRHEIVQSFVNQMNNQFNWKLDVRSTSHEILSSIEASVGKPSELVHIGEFLSHGMLALLVCIVSSIYFIIDSERVGSFCLRFVPAERRETVVNLSGQMNQMLSRYCRGQLVLIVVMSCVAWLFLHYAIHMQYALPIAMVSGFFEIIPVLGPILATSTATLVGFAQFNSTVAAEIIIFYTLARWAEDYIVVPRVIGHAVHLHPLIVIFAVLCGEIMAGALGMLIAIPVAASIKVIVDTIYPEQKPPAAVALPQQASSPEIDQTPVAN